MKRITLMMLSMLLTLTVSCQNAPISNTADGTFTVNGSASFRNNGDTVWLVNSNGWIYLDSTLVKWGKFSLTGSSDTSFMATVMYGEDWDKLPLVVEPGMNVTLDLAKCTATEVLSVELSRPLASTALTSTRPRVEVCAIFSAPLRYKRHEINS